MTGKELIRRVIDYQNPPRVGYDFNPPHKKDIQWIGGGRLLNPTFTSKAAWGDYPEVRAQFPDFQGEFRYDVFGNIYGRLEGITKGECIKGALSDGFHPDGFALPTLDLSYYEELRGQKLGEKDAFVLASAPMAVFSNFRDLRLMDQALMDLLLEPEEVEELLGKILALLLEATRHCGEVGCDGLILYDDWGMQHATFISPDSFRRFFKPMYAAIAAEAHRHQMKLFVHSCGLVHGFMEDFIDAGVDVMQFDQPELSGSKVLAQEFGGRIAFHCPVDIQKVMATGDRAFIEKSAFEMLEAFRPLKGGLIAKDYPTWQDIHVEEEWATWARDVMEAHGAY